MHVYELLLLGSSGPDVTLRAHCSGGTYMRSIAHDLGRLAGCGAHLRELRRLSSGEFDLAQARTIAQLESLAADERLIDALVPAAQMLPGVPSVFVDEVHGRADSQRPQLPGIAVPVAAGLAIREGRDPAG